MDPPLQPRTGIPPESIPSAVTELGALAFSRSIAEQALQRAQSQLQRTVSELSPPNQYPQSTIGAEGLWNPDTLFPASGSDRAYIGWTQGFLPGLLWYMFLRTRNTSWRDQAAHWTGPLDAQRYNMRTHDLGFKLVPSFVQAFSQLNTGTYRDVAVIGAGALASRFNPLVGVISCCDWNPDWQLPVVIDTMMNLELLLWGATQNTRGQDPHGQEGWRHMALSHARKTLAEHVRADGSTYQVVDYDPDTGAVLFKGTYQGHSHDSSWARGQAWAMYGYAMLYRYTSNSGMLEAARKVCDYYLSQLPEDGIPNWDFHPAAQRQKDSSAAAIAASALLEMSTFPFEPEKKRQYWERAVQTLNTLSSTSYLATSSNSHGILLHGVGNLRAGHEVGVSLIYGDYYFVEALHRYLTFPEPTPSPPGVWRSRLNFADAVHLLGTTYTGVHTIEYDVVPLGYPIDGVVGYADSSTTITDYKSHGMLVRMNDEGVFDVRNGATYTYVTRMPYAANRRYHVRIQADMPAKRYSVWIRPEGGAEVNVANRYFFRADAPPTNDIGQVSIKSGYHDDEFQVENHRISS
jgi:unsaturated chondroitin disaccharide hydrolase